jgi:hydrogenase assembly chaperone hypC/hupF
MCVGLAAKVVKVKGNIALVDASGARRQVSAELIENLDPGDYVMVHAGTAIAKISSNDIEETTELLEDL